MLQLCLPSFRLLAALALLHPIAMPEARANTSGSGRDTTLVKAIDDAINVPGLLTGFHGILIQSLADQSVFYEVNADQVFLPASNNKLLTAGAALGLLGKEFVYRTRLYRTGPISRSGILTGNLILRGDGDPLLMPDDLKRLAKRARLAGIRLVKGSVGYDDSRFDPQRLGEGWSWDDEPFYYSAQVSALNLNENVVSVQPWPGKRPGDPVRVAVGPIPDYITLINRARTGAPKTRGSLVITRERGKNVVILEGSLPIDADAKSNAPVGVTIENPGRYAATALKYYLQKEGIRVSRSEILAIRARPRADALVAEHISAPMPELLRRLNKPSDNLVAECLLKTVGTTSTHTEEPASTARGAKAATEWFLRIGLDTDRVRLADGSGLSRQNFVSPRNLVRLLTYFHTDQHGQIFRDSLPIAGADGTLRRRMKGTAAEKNCLAKTGTLSNMSSLSGYVTTKDGEPLVFSILMNNYLTSGVVARAAQDKIVTLLADYSRKGTSP
jgi:D-alanyl-D-alanine carboxypeptidase/D-alanyl-D-alanine-endopeptidase (penicillin-binding protein 4)